jgi:hypothetical protein
VVWDVREGLLYKHCLTATEPSRWLCEDEDRGGRKESQESVQGMKMVSVVYKKEKLDAAVYKDTSL